MQTVIQIIANGSKSLREKIIKEKQLEAFGLEVAQQKNPNRAQGWSKLHMPGEHGAINIQWHAASQVLICRIVTRGGKPHAIAGAFTSFLLARLQKDIASIQILPG